jgi:hypothetical protein
MKKIIPLVMLALIGCTHEKGSITSSKEADADIPVVNSISFVVKTKNGNFEYTSFVTPTGAECTFYGVQTTEISCR